MLSKISPPPIYPPNFSQNVLLLTSGKTSVQLKQIATKKLTLTLTLNLREELGRGTQITRMPQKSHKKKVLKHNTTYKPRSVPTAFPTENLGQKW